MSQCECGDRLNLIGYIGCSSETTTGMLTGASTRCSCKQQDAHTSTIPQPLCLPSHKLGRATSSANYQRRLSQVVLQATANGRLLHRTALSVFSTAPLDLFCFRSNTPLSFYPNLMPWPPPEPVAPSRRSTTAKGQLTCLIHETKQQRKLPVNCYEQQNMHASAAQICCNHALPAQCETLNL